MEWHSFGVSYDTMFIRLHSTSKCNYPVYNMILYTREREREKKETIRIYLKEKGEKKKNIQRDDNSGNDDTG